MTDVTVNVNTTENDVTAAITVSEAAVTVTIDDTGQAWKHISDTGSSVSSVASGLTLADYTSRSDAAERISVWSGGRKRMYQSAFGWDVSGDNIVFVGADGSTAQALAREDYEIIIRLL